MKKLFFVMLLCIAIVMLASCGGGEASTDEPILNGSDGPLSEEVTEAPTEAPTEVPTETLYDVPTETPTEIPTVIATESPTEPPLDAPTEAPYEAPPEESGEAPTEAPYDAPGKEPAEDPTEVPTEVPAEKPTEEVTDTPTEVPSETSTDSPAETPAEVWWDNSDVREDLAHYTVELTKTVYTTDDVGVKYRVRAKNPGYIGFSDNWKLYKFVDGEKIYVGNNPLESALELSPKTEGGYVDQEMPFLFRNIYTSGMQQLEKLEVGRYCLEMHRGNDENGVPIVIARLNFEVVEAE